MTHEEFVAKTKTPEQMLGHMTEEAGELFMALGMLVTAIGKTVRFGPDSVNPLLPKAQQERNIDWLLREMAKTQGEMDDLKKAMDRFKSAIEQTELD